MTDITAWIGNRVGSYCSRMTLTCPRSISSENNQTGSTAMLTSLITASRTASELSARETPTDIDLYRALVAIKVPALSGREPGVDHAVVAREVSRRGGNAA